MIVYDALRRRFPLAGAAVALALLLAGCGEGAAPKTTDASAAPTPQVSPTTAVEAVESSLPALSDAVAAVGDRYAFAATVTVDGEEITRVEGSVYDGVGSYLLVSGESRVQYVISPEGQWARPEGGQWEVLSGPAPLADPLAPLGSPLSSTVVSRDGADGRIAAIYPAGKIGFAAGGEVRVAIVVQSGALREVSYEALVGDATAVVVTTFDPTAVVVPIEVPPA